MKKLLFSALFAITSIAQAAPWDLNGQQYDQFGTSMINRLMPLPTGGANGIYVYSASLNLPKLATYDSTLTLSGLVLGVNPTTLAGKFDTPTGNAGQYIAGNGSLITFPTAVSFFSNDSAYVNQAGARSAVSLTTTGTGAATYNSATGVLNVPTPAIPAAPSQSAQTRSLNSAFQISSTRPSLVTYSIRITTTASIGGNQDGDVILEIASDSGFTTNVQTLSITQNAQAISLAVVLNSVQTQTGVLSGFVPAGYYARLRTVNNTGTPTFTYRAGQEVLM